MQEEMVYVVNEKDEVIRKTTRKEVRKEALLHRDVSVIVTNNKGKFLIQKRSDKKDLYPGFWDCGLGETVKAGETYSQAAVRGLKEEFGIRGISEKDLEKFFVFKFTSPIHNALCTNYHLSYDGKIKLIDGEAVDYKFITEEEVKELISKEKFHPVRKIVFEKYLELKND